MGAELLELLLCGSVNTVATANPTVEANGMYQRFSYDPMALTSSQNLSGTVEAQPNTLQNQTNYGQPQRSFAPSRSAVQSYRRFSYQPTTSNRSNRSPDRKEKWEYSKGDPRKQQH